MAEAAATTDHPPQSMETRQFVYLVLAAAFITALLVANIVGSKFFHFGTIRIGSWDLHVEHSVGMFAFPVTFLLTDLLNEYYGKRGARRVTYLGLGMSLFAFTLIYLGTIAPPAPPGRTFIAEDSFDLVLGASGRMIIASMVAYTIGQLTDIAAFGMMKRLTGGRMVWLRATGSTVLSQFVDSLCIMTVLYFFQRLADGQQPNIAFTLEAALKGYLIKFVIAVLVTPLIYAGRALLQRRFGLVPLPPEGSDGFRP
ncbi:MAG: queuosine precursor transporter [Phycisphaerales bacterium]